MLKRMVKTELSFGWETLPALKTDVITPILVVFMVLFRVFKFCQIISPRQPDAVSNVDTRFGCSRPNLPPANEVGGRARDRGWSSVFSNNLTL